MDHTIFSAVDQYINGLFNAPDAALTKTAAHIETSGIPQISISANQGKFLYLLARLQGAKRILEIGTLGGYSTIWLARALPEDGKLVTLELEQTHADVAGRNIRTAGLENKVAIRVGSALDEMNAMISAGTEPFDLVFIYADKPPYAEYFQQALKLSRPGTLIIADNVIREGKVMDPENSDPVISGVRRFNNVLAASDAVTATIIQTVGDKEHDGIALAIVN